MKGRSLLGVMIPSLIAATAAGALAGCASSSTESTAAKPSGAIIERNERNEVAASLQREEAAETAKNRELLSELEAKKREEAAEAKAKKTEQAAVAKAKKREKAAALAAKKKEQAAEENAKKKEQAAKAEAKKKQEAAKKAKEVKERPTITLTAPQTKTPATPGPGG
ncbi:MAG TPA: hypothetical protein VES97_04720 [Solirubrobacteraceae bacterium]|nr:hypothetical protein [Solirubrobacteraceae bacterium]